MRSKCFLHLFISFVVFQGSTFRKNVISPAGLVIITFTCPAILLLALKFDDIKSTRYANYLCFKINKNSLGLAIMSSPVFEYACNMFVCMLYTHMKLLENVYFVLEMNDLIGLSLSG